MKNGYFRYERLFNEYNGSNDLINGKKQLNIILRGVKIMLSSSLRRLFEFTQYSLPVAIRDSGLSLGRSYLRIPS